MNSAIVRSVALLAILTCGLVSAQEPTRSTITVPDGTRILVRTVDSVDSSKQKAGFRFSATLETNLQVEDVVVAPRGTPVHGLLTSAESAGRMAGGATLTLRLTDIVINNTAYPLKTGAFQLRSKGNGEKTTRRVLGGTGLGALIGGIAGGGAGAAIGAVSGAAAGTAVSAAKPGEQVSVPSESLLEFQLQEATSLPVAR